MLALLCLALTRAWAGDVIAGQEDSSKTAEGQLKTIVENCDKKKSEKPAFKTFTLKAGQLNTSLADIADKDKKDHIEKNLAELNSLAVELADPGVNNDMAALNNMTGNWSKAKELSEQNLARDPNDKDALISRSNAFYGMKDYRSAHADADRATKIDPKNSSALTSRALASYGLGNYLQSLEDSRRALALNPNDKTAFSLMKLSEGRVQPTLDLSNPQSLQAALVQREYQGMVQQIAQVEEKSRQPIPAEAAPSLERLNRSAAAKITLKDYWGAVADAEKAISLSQSSADSYYYRAAAFNLLGQHEKAAEDATEALSIDPNHNPARDARTWAFYRLGRFKEAVADANSSLELNPRNAYAFANRGYAHERMGDLGAMLSDLKSAAALNPQFEPSYRDAAAMNNITPQSIPGSFIPQPKPEPKPLAALGRKRHFLSVLVSSVVGGFLIALGLLHIMSAHWTKKITAELQRAQQALTGSGRKPSTIDTSYEMGKVLGQGGMGVVYEAIDKALKRKVAVKMLRPELKTDAHERERLLQEARTVAALHHPAIVEIHSIMEDEAGLYLIFEHVDGKPLDDLLHERKKLSLRQTKAILKPVCQALDFAHRHGVVHRDLKPSNVMLSVDGDVKVMDFGIARTAKDSMAKFSQASTVTGTPHYMAPEQESGIVRKESDVYSLGCCLYEMLTGERPYHAQAALSNKLERKYAKPREIDPSLPTEIDTLIDNALHPDPDQRIHSPKDFWALLDRIPG